jgi:hypothetical protein
MQTKLKATAQTLPLVLTLLAIDNIMLGSS